MKLTIALMLLMLGTLPTFAQAGCIRYEYGYDGQPHMIWDMDADDDFSDRQASSAEEDRYRDHEVICPPDFYQTRKSFEDSKNRPPSEPEAPRWDESKYR